jgi:single-strand DNA-binding protein
MNVVVFSGNLGGDMEVRHTPNGKAVGDFSLPVKQGYGDYEKTSWVSCKVLGDRAIKLEQYLTKGTKVVVQGEFVYEEWEKDGVRKGKPVVIVSSLEFVSRSAETGNAKPVPSEATPPTNFDNFDQDIPF